MKSKKHLKRFKELLKVLESATTAEEFKKYMRFYTEVRRNRIKSKATSSESGTESLIAATENARASILEGPNTNYYQRGSHPVMIQVNELATFIEVSFVIKNIIYSFFK